MKSDNVKKGMQQAPHRSLFNALGFTEEEMNKPMVGIVSSYNEIVPGHMNLDKIVNAVKLGVAEAGGVPVVFPAIAVCDGIAMGHIGMKYSLVTRDLIADSTECMALAHQFDALVMVPNCDKNVPGLLMAAARINVPTVFVSGGPMLAGHVQGKKRSLSSMFEAVGSYAAGTMTEEEVKEYEEKVCPTCGSCSGMYTANSMNCLTEAIGMGLRGNGTIPAVWSARLRLAKHAGMQIMELVEKDIRPRDVMTPAAFHNAETVDMALGCSTNTMLHLPAIAHEFGFEILRQGKFSAERAKEQDIPLKYWNPLQKGQTIEADGITYTPEMVLGPARKGIRLTYTTDTRPTESILRNAKESDLFICEGMYGEDDKADKARGYKHMTFREAAVLARDARVKEMWLTHYSPSLVRPDEFMDKVREIFPNAYPGKDGKSLELNFEE